MSKSKVLRLSFIVATVALLATPGTAVAQGPPATMDVDSDVVTWEPQIENGGLVLRIGGPCGFQLVEEFDSEGPAVFYSEGLEDGAYQWELLFLPVDGQEPSDDPGRGLEFGCDPVVLMTDTISVVNEEFVQPEEQEEGRAPEVPSLRAPDDIVHNDDVIIDGSLCVGFDCTSGMSFNYDTIILKENNLRIYFHDTSYISSYPTNDWRISINSSADGGGSYFAVDDVTGGRTPFKIEAGAPSSSLYVEDSGQVGIGTSNPYLELHIKDGDTPSVRLQQDGSVGFSAQTWDVAGNESNFFIRDATNGSLLPFRIKPGAPTSSLTILDDGDVGVGTWSPDEALHVEGSGGDTMIKVEETSGTTAARALLLLTNNGTPRMAFQNTNNGAVWNVAMLGSNSFAILKGLPAPADRQFVLQDDGDLTIDGTLTENSNANDKQDVVAVDGGEVLAAVAELPISTWSYADDESGARHLGPMAQDFHAAFGLGETDTGIASLDTSGVALAAIQGLNEVVAEKDAQIEALEARLSAVEQAAGLRPVSFVTLLPWLLLAVVTLAAGLAVGLALGRRQVSK